MNSEVQPTHPHKHHTWNINGQISVSLRVQQIIFLIWMKNHSVYLNVTVTLVVGFGFLNPNIIFMRYGRNEDHRKALKTDSGLRAIRP